MKTLLIAALTLGAILTQKSIATAESFYTQGELTIDAAGTYSTAKSKLNDSFDKGIKHGTAGYSFGFQYFPKLNFGFGADAVVRDASHVRDGWLDSVNASLVARLPIGRFAPYALGGFGHDLEFSEWTPHAGAGVEFRVTRKIGLFGDARYTWHENTPKGRDELMCRAGFRVAF